MSIWRRLPSPGKIGTKRLNVPIRSSSYSRRNPSVSTTGTLWLPSRRCWALANTPGPSPPCGPSSGEGVRAGRCSPSKALPISAPPGWRMRAGIGTNTGEERIATGTSPRSATPRGRSSTRRTKRISPLAHQRTMPRLANEFASIPPCLTATTNCGRRLTSRLAWTSFVSRTNRLLPRVGRSAKLSCRAVRRR